MLVRLYDKLVDETIFWSLFELYKNYCNKISDEETKIEKFKFLVKEFNSILTLYNELVCKSVERIKKIAEKEGILAGSKKQYKKRREEYIDYLKGYKNFSDKINQKLGEKYFRTYFELPKEL